MKRLSVVEILQKRPARLEPQEEVPVVDGKRHACDLSEFAQRSLQLALLRFRAEAVQPHRLVLVILVILVLLHLRHSIRYHSLATEQGDHESQRDQELHCTVAGVDVGHVPQGVCGEPRWLLQLIPEHILHRVGQRKGKGNGKRHHHHSGPVHVCVNTAPKDFEDFDRAKKGEQPTVLALGCLRDLGLLGNLYGWWGNNSLEAFAHLFTCHMTSPQVLEL